MNVISVSRNRYISPKNNERRFQSKDVTFPITPCQQLIKDNPENVPLFLRLFPDFFLQDEEKSHLPVSPLCLNGKRSRLGNLSNNEADEKHNGNAPGRGTFHLFDISDSSLKGSSFRIFCSLVSMSSSFARTNLQKNRLLPFHWHSHKSVPFAYW